VLERFEEILNSILASGPR